MPRARIRRQVYKMMNTGTGLPTAVVIPGTLAVTGASTLTGDVTMTGAASVGTTLGVTGAATLSSTLDVTTSVTTPTIAADTLTEKTTNKGVAAGAALRRTGTTTTASGDIVLTAASTYLQRIDCNGSHRNVDLPALTGTTENGMEFEFQNISGTAVNIVVRLTGAGATVVTVNQTEKATVKVIAGAWVHTGVISAALS